MHHFVCLFSFSSAIPQVDSAPGDLIKRNSPFTNVYHKDSVNSRGTPICALSNPRFHFSLHLYIYMYICIYIFIYIYIYTCVCVYIHGHMYKMRRRTQKASPSIIFCHKWHLYKRHIIHRPLSPARVRERTA